MAKMLVDDSVSATPAAERAPGTGREPLVDAKSVLSRLAAVPGVALAVLLDPEGFLIESAGDMVFEAEVAGALAGCLAEASKAAGHELSHGTLVACIAEYEAGAILVNMAGSGAMLATVLRDASMLDEARSVIKTALSDLHQVV